jgi:hypothetical protein
MANEQQKSGKITENSARELSQVVKWYRSLPKGTVGVPKQPSKAATKGGPWLGVTQQDIPSGSSGNVNYWSGTKGSETDSGVTVSVYSRNVTVKNATFIVFDYLDAGLEIILPTTGISQNPAYGSGICPCSCITGESATYWQITAQYQPVVGLNWPLQNCCGSSDTPHDVLFPLSSGVWQSNPFACKAKDNTVQQVRWNLASDESGFLNLTLTVGTGSNQTQVQYRVKDYSSVCSNTISLWEPLSVPGGSSCFLPCQLCLIPIQQFYCSMCPQGSVVANATFTTPADFTASMNSQTYNLGVFATTGDSPPAQTSGCQWSLTGVPGANNTKAKIVLDMKGKVGDPASNSAMTITMSLGLPGAAWSQFEGQPTIVFSALYAKCDGLTTFAPLSASNWPNIANSNPTFPTDWNLAVTMGITVIH